jgi:hypothetical protein
MSFYTVREDFRVRTTRYWAGERIARAALTPKEAEIAIGAGWIAPDGAEPAPPGHAPVTLDMNHAASTGAS